jgi:hypothetical protein
MASPWGSWQASPQKDLLLLLVPVVVVVVLLLLLVPPQGCQTRL